MKILCVVQRYYPIIGGAENHVKELMDHLSKNHDVTVFTTTAFDQKAFWDKDAEKIQQYTFDNYKVKRFDILPLSEINWDKYAQDFPLALSNPGPFSPKLWEELVIKKIDYDLIFAASFPFNHILPAYVASKKWNIPIIIMPLIHSDVEDNFLTPIKLSMLYHADGIIVNTNHEKKILSRLDC